MQDRFEKKIRKDAGVLSSSAAIASPPQVAAATPPQTTNEEDVSDEEEEEKSKHGSEEHLPDPLSHISKRCDIWESIDNMNVKLGM